MFGRENFAHTVIKLAPGAYDEVFTCNPQSGTQWDGFRHVWQPCFMQALANKLVRTPWDKIILQRGQ
jgi:hypothetical protein